MSVGRVSEITRRIEELGNWRGQPGVLHVALNKATATRCPLRSAASASVSSLSTTAGIVGHVRDSVSGLARCAPSLTQLATHLAGDNRTTRPCCFSSNAT